MGPAHRIAVPLLQRQADPEPVLFRLEPERPHEPDEVVGDIELAEAFRYGSGHGSSPSFEAVRRSSIARTTGSNGVARWVSSFSDTMITF